MVERTQQVQKKGWWNILNHITKKGIPTAMEMYCKVYGREDVDLS